MKTIIFIASEVRSGSTLLEQLLSNNQGYINVGELSNLHSYLNLDDEAGGRPRDWVCRCGKRFADCDFWSVIIKCFENNNVDLQTLETCAPSIKRNVKFILKLFLSRFHSKEKLQDVLRLNYHSDESSTAGGNIYRVYDVLERVTGKNLFIDSSKKVERLFALLSTKPAGYKIKVIHVVRDGRAVTHSIIKRAEEIGVKKKYFRVLIGWALTNVLIEQFKVYFSKEDFVRINYEDLCENSTEAMFKLCNDLNIPFDDSMTTISGEVTHNVGGSPRQYKKGTLIKLDERWKGKVDMIDNVNFYLVTKVFGMLFGQRLS